MELRDIEIFLVLAEELHFGRTAARLHVSQARVSQAIKAQERRLGAPLFDRTSRRVRLTPLGQQLRADLRPVYAGLRDSLERAHLAARGITAVLRVGMTPGNAHDLRAYWQTFRSRHPQWDLRIRHAPFTDPFAVLREGTVDVLVTWLPVVEDDLTVGPALFTDPRLLAVAVDHELATRSAASIEMLADFQHTNSPRLPGYWADGFLPPHTPRGHRIVRGPLVTHMEVLLALVSVGEVVNSLPAHSARYWSRPDIAWLPFHDFEPLTYVLVWHTEAENDVVRALAQTVRDLGPLHLSLS
ncbi:LysR family transcriptional regulator [Nonomuraea sp. NPDC049695]|uniref:LysR family transcriptional regulator n=1 Tax=Nonomuraea sp. NPDC049695 TaxID=3154734 RepID=UPI00343C613D